MSKIEKKSFIMCVDFAKNSIARADQTSQLFKNVHFTQTFKKKKLIFVYFTI